MHFTTVWHRHFLYLFFTRFALLMPVYIRMTQYILICASKTRSIAPVVFINHILSVRGFEMRILNQLTFLPTCVRVQSALHRTLVTMSRGRISCARACPSPGTRRHDDYIYMFPTCRHMVSLRPSCVQNQCLPLLGGESQNKFHSFIE